MKKRYHLYFARSDRSFFTRYVDAISAATRVITPMACMLDLRFGFQNHCLNQHAVFQLLSSFDIARGFFRTFVANIPPASG